MNKFHGNTERQLDVTIYTPIVNSVFHIFTAYKRKYNDTTTDAQSRQIIFMLKEHKIVFSDVITIL